MNLSSAVSSFVERLPSLSDMIPSFASRSEAYVSKDTVSISKKEASASSKNTDSVSEADATPKDATSSSKDIAPGTFPEGDEHLTYIDPRDGERKPYPKRNASKLSFGKMSPLTKNALVTFGIFGGSMAVLLNGAYKTGLQKLIIEPALNMAHAATIAPVVNTAHAITDSTLVNGTWQGAVFVSKVGMFFGRMVSKLF